MSRDPAIDGYDQEAPDLVGRFEAIDPAMVYAPVADLLPAAPTDMLEVGAGTGRDAAWFARRGWRVTAVEPAAGLREAGRALHEGDAIDWIDDRLPGLEATLALGRTFPFVLLTAVWHHLDEDARGAALGPLAALLAPGGRLLLSIRHEPEGSAWHSFAADPDHTVGAAEALGLSLAARRHCQSVSPENRAAGVTWTWLAFDRPRA